MGFAKRLLRLARRAWAWLRRGFATLLPCRFAFLVLGLVTVILALTDQGLESLRVMAEFGNPDQVGAREPYLLRLLIFFLGTSALASSAWYFSRQALLLDPPPRPVTREVEVLFRWAPRVFGMLGFACPALALWFAASQYGAHDGLDQNPSPRALLKILAVAFFLLGLLFGLLLSIRRSRFALESLDIPEGRRRVRQLPVSSQAVLWISAFVTLALFVGIIVAPIRLTAFVATPSVVLFCAAIWVFVGTVLVVSSVRLRLPLFTALLLLLIVSSGSNDNHRVLPAGTARARPGLAEATSAWVSWMDEHYPEEPRHPVFVVAAEGGGLRAGYWTAAVLTGIHAQFPTFSDHCFAISGVSGGSLGAAVFDGLLAARPADFRIAAREVLSHDFLAPTVARLFGTDLPQQFVPWPILPDRGSAMERAWERAWNRVASGTFSRPFLEMALEHRPALFLNGTEVETGRRVIFSPIRIEPSATPPVSQELAFKNARDGLDLLGGDLPVSGAVHMSARFTYVSPAGTIRAAKSIHRIVDGGYFENSGAATAAEILQYLQSVRNPSRDRLDPRVILITHSEKPLPGSEALSEELAPLRALFATRVARGDHAVAELRLAVGPEGWTEFNLRTDQGVPLPLGWLLSAQARRAIDAAIDSPPNKAARSQIGGLLTELPQQASRNNSPDRLSQTARRQEPSKGVGAAIRQIVKGR
jgi:hypothetical protein